MPDSKFAKTFLDLVSFVAISSVFAFWTNCTIAQITPDATLPNNSRVTTQGNLKLIEGGTQAGSNLFHSFQQFSLPTGNSAYFNNGLDTQNIISRVTGSSISNIDGLIRANGTANLFLINPNGIIFGPNASLNIGGSFLASTTNSLNFADGIQFSAKTEHATPLLTVSIPIGLGFGENPVRILVQGDGQGLRSTPELIDTAVGLRVQPNQTLALVGGDISLEGATLKTAGGHIELGSVAGPGMVSLTPTNKGWTLGYDGIQNFRDIQLSQQAAVDASGKGGGDIQVQGRRVTLTDGPQIENSTLGTQAGGTLVVTGTESVELSGTSTKGDATSLASQVYPGARGAGGNLTIKTGQLIVRDGAQISSGTGGTGSAGSLTVLARDSVDVSGASADGLVLSGLFTSAYPGARGAGGNLTIKTGQLIVRDGAQISSGTSGAGSAGSLTVLARDSVKVTGTATNKKMGETFSSTLGTTSEPGAIGDGGDLILETQQLTVQNAVISTATFGKGMGGNLSIKADSIELSGSSLSNILSVSGLSSRSEGVGKVGNLTIETGQLSVRDQAQITARNSNAENAGFIRINGNSVNLDHQGSITASTASSKGGEIFLNTQNLQLRHNSTISATAGNRGDGGNITINAGTLVGLETSKITANAFEGRGGNIKVNTQGLFLSPDSQITATSEKGVNGSVQINAPENDLSRAVIFPTAVNPPNIALNCAGKSGGAATGSLVNAGKGGIPPSPSDLLSEQDNSTPVQGEPIEQKPEQKVVEAQGWKNNGDGTISFTAEPDSDPVVPLGSLSDPPCHHSQSSEQTNNQQ